MAVPAKPSTPAVETTYSNAVKLSWTAASDVDRYVVYKSTDGTNYYATAEFEGVGSGTQQEVVTALEPSTTYYFKISGFNADGESPLSDPVSTSTLAKSTTETYSATDGRKVYDKNAYYESTTYEKSAIGAGGKGWFSSIQVDDYLIADTYIETEWFIIADATGLVWRLQPGASELEFYSYNSASVVAKIYPDGSVEIGSGSAYYMGDKDTDGSWRMMRDGNNLVFQRRESGSWVTKQTIYA